LLAAGRKIIRADRLPLRKIAQICPADGNGVTREIQASPLLKRNPSFRAMR
jgi:hypothetical protein